MRRGKKTNENDEKRRGRRTVRLDGKVVKTGRNESDLIQLRWRRRRRSDSRNVILCLEASLRRDCGSHTEERCCSFWFARDGSLVRRRFARQSTEERFHRGQSLLKRLDVALGDRPFLYPLLWGPTMSVRVTTEE